MWSRTLYPAILALAASARGLNISANNPVDLSLAVKQTSNGVLSYYGDDSGGIGVFPDPYYWYESGVAWDSLVNYWYLTGDISYEAATQAALSVQSAENGDYMPLNQTKSEGNDDQIIWALAALSAAERGFPVAANSTNWEQKAQAVFEEMSARWDSSVCGGGLRWQIYSFNNGYNYKNSISQALFFQLAARLARFTGNQTYVDSASQAYEWMLSSGLLTDEFAVLDGTDATSNCTKFNRVQWSYTSAAFAYGSAILANITSDSQWADRTTGHVEKLLQTFFPSNILSEVACEGTTTSEDDDDDDDNNNSSSNTCTVDQVVMPAMTIRWLSLVPVFQPRLAESISAGLNATALAAASKCDVVEGDGEAGVAACRGRWNVQDGGDTRSDLGLGQQLAALEALQSRYVINAEGAVNASVVLRTAESSGAGNATTGSESGGDGGSGNGTATASGGSGTSGTAAASAAARGWELPWYPLVMVLPALALLL